MAETDEKPFDPAEVLRKQIADRFTQRIADVRRKIADLERDLKDRLEADATLRIVLDGEGGGTWYVRIRGGEAKVDTSAGDQPPVLSIYQSLAGFRTAAAIGALGFGGPGGQNDLTKSRIARMQNLKGTIEFRVTDMPDGGDLSVVTHFGAGDRAPEPQATIAVKAEVAQKLRTGELNPQMAFMQGMLRVSGDTALVMAVGAAMMM